MTLSMKCNNITSVSDALMCSNCGACAAICPKGSISFRTTALGRMFAVINDSCINCGLCLKVCPSIDRLNLHKTFSDKYIGTIKTVHVGKSTDRLYYKNGQSGGICSTLLDYLFETDAIDSAIVCKMSYGTPPIVTAVVINDRKQLYECQKSCYTPVDLLSVLRSDNLSSRRLAIVGLPCQIQGAESLIRTCKKFSNIKYKIGLVCDRSLCGGISNVIMSYFPDKEAKIIWRRKDFTFNRKYYPYKNAPMSIIYKDGASYVMPAVARHALKDYFTSPRCRVCYDKLNSFADIVLGDPWGMDGIDWDKGESVIATRTDIGKNMLDAAVSAGRIVLRDSMVAELVKGQHIDARRVSVSAYSKALQVIPDKIDSYLYNQSDVACGEALVEQKEILDFMRRDSLDSESIIAEGKRLVDKSIINCRVNSLLVVKILRKIKRYFKK